MPNNGADLSNNAFVLSNNVSVLKNIGVVFTLSRTYTKMNQDFHRVLAVTALMVMLRMEMIAQTLPYIAEGIIDTTDTQSLGLAESDAVRAICVFSPTDADNHYANGVVLTAFKDVLYCMWQSSRINEDAPETCVVYSHSTDDGMTWTKPKILAQASDTAYCTSGGWMANGDTLTAFINIWPKGIQPIGGYTYAIRSGDGKNWTAPHPVMMADGNRLDGVIEQDPYSLHDGRIVGAAHMQPGLHLAPIYTDNPSGCGGWHKGTMDTHDKGKQSQELEPSIYMQSNGTLVMIQRDQNSSYRKMASLSHDRGETWTEPAVINIPDARVKQSAGNLPDGTAYMVGNPTGAKRRYPLVALFSNDGICFDKAILLRAGNSDLQPQRYPGKAKTLGYNYPKSMVYNGRLYVAYATNKEDVEITMLSLSRICAKSSDYLQK